MDLRNRLIHFRIRDVFFPEMAEILNALHGDEILQGTVMDVSDSGSEEQVFAVVKVEGVEQPVIIPVSRILGVL